MCKRGATETKKKRERGGGFPSRVPPGGGPWVARLQLDHGALRYSSGDQQPAPTANAAGCARPCARARGWAGGAWGFLTVGAVRGRRPGRRHGRRWAAGMGMARAAELFQYLSNRRRDRTFDYSSKIIEDRSREVSLLSSSRTKPHAQLRSTASHLVPVCSTPVRVRGLGCERRASSLRWLLIHTVLEPARYPAAGQPPYCSRD